ncbi:hypothetical protein OROMI_029663 [Orobanche minor]
MFQSRDDMTNLAKAIKLRNGFVIIIDKSANKIGNKLPKYTLICDWGTSHTCIFNLEKICKDVPVQKNIIVYFF